MNTLRNEQEVLEFRPSCTPLMKIQMSEITLSREANWLAILLRRSNIGGVWGSVLLIKSTYKCSAELCQYELSSLYIQFGVLDQSFQKKGESHGFPGSK